MADKPENENVGDSDPETREGGFGLGRPTGEIAKPRSGDRPALPPAESDQASSKIDAREKVRGGLSWKGFEEEQLFEPEVSFAVKRDKSEEEMDMTPMVDVVFLLLIFFMVTASFTLQKSIEQPPVSTEDPSLNVITNPEDEEEFVEVIIDQYNNYRLTSRDVQEIEAPSDNEMRVQMKDMVNATGAKKLIITAHGDSTHDKTVTAWDAGIDNNLQEIVIRTTEDDF